jgi:hypothetical protein
VTATELKDIIKKTLVRYKDEAEKEKKRGKKPANQKRLNRFGF